VRGDGEEDMRRGGGGDGWPTLTLTPPPLPLDCSSVSPKGLSTSTWICLAAPAALVTREVRLASTDAPLEARFRRLAPKKLLAGLCRKGNGFKFG